MRILTTWILPAAAASTLAAQGPATNAATRVARALDAQVLRAHLEFLADDALEGRAPGTRGGETAAKYIAAQFERLRLEPAGDGGTWFQRVPIIALTPEPTLEITGTSGGPLAWKQDYVLRSMRNDSLVTVRGDAVFAGYGIVAPEYGWNDYEGIDPRGKIVIVLVNDPGLQDSTIFRGKILTYYGRWTYKIEEAQRQGAAGVLMVHTPESATYPWTTVLSAWVGPQVRLETPPGSLVVAGWLQQDAAARLFGQGGQDLAALTVAAARRGFRPVPLKLQLDATVRSVVRRSATENVLGRWPGHGPLAREAVLIGGHYDHFGIGAPVNGDSIYNGAEDNASGTAGVLAAAEAFARSGVHPSRSVVFIGFAAEEAGLLGSQALATRPPFPLRDMAAILNVDILDLYGRTRDFSALGLDQSSVGDAITRAAASEGLKVTSNLEALIAGWFFRSDHFSLARAGVPGTSLESGSDFVGHPHGWGREQHEKYIAERYHQPSDEVQPWFNYDGALQQLRVIVRTAVIIANAPEQPKWSAGSEFRQAGQNRLQGSTKETYPRTRPTTRALPSLCGPTYLPGRLRPDRLAGAFLDLPNQHRIPLTWLLENAGPPIRYRTLTELAPPGYASPDATAAAHTAVIESKAALAVVKKQKDTGVWGGNLLGLAPSAAQGIKDIGTIPQYRRLLQLGWPRSGRPFKLGDRVLFRLLSRDEDPALLFEFQKLSRSDGEAETWARGIMREASSAALAEAGYGEDPRLRGAGHKIANAISQFLRSPLAEKPFTKSGSQMVLHPEAHPPSWYSVAMLSFMPNLQRERAGFTERLGHYLAQPAPKRAFIIQVGKRTVKPQHLLLGDPIDADSKGQATDIPLALHYIELMARMAALPWAPVATRALGRLLKDCDELGIWRPKNLRSQPKAVNRITYHYYPLHGDAKTTEGREVDVTFRLALIAKLLGWSLDFV